jgi:hypothetical protein
MHVAAVASAIGLGGTALADDLHDNAAAQLDAKSAAVTDANAAAQLDTKPAAATGNNAAEQRDTKPAIATDGNAAAQLDTKPASATATGTTATYGTTQGSTMTSPQGARARNPAGASGPGAAATSSTSTGGHDRLATTNSDNFDQWMSDYAAQHGGRITREQFLDEMGNRWDVIDAQRNGSLTPGEVREIFIFENAAPSGGSDVQPGAANAGGR